MYRIIRTAANAILYGASPVARLSRVPFSVFRFPFSGAA